MHRLRHPGLHRLRGGRPVRGDHPLRLRGHLPGGPDAQERGGLPGEVRLERGGGPAGPQRQRGRGQGLLHQVRVSGDLRHRQPGRVPLPPSGGGGHPLPRRRGGGPQPGAGGEPGRGPGGHGPAAKR